MIEFVSFNLFEIIYLFNIDKMIEFQMNWIISLIPLIYWNEFMTLLIMLIIDRNYLFWQLDSEILKNKRKETMNYWWN